MSSFFFSQDSESKTCYAYHVVRKGEGKGVRKTMERYTIQDIEFIRRKSGISYQEAVALLDYHNGNVTRALVDLERNGRIKPESDNSNHHNSAAEKHQGAKGGFAKLMTKLYRCRIKVKKNDIPIVNLSLLFMLTALLISPHLALLALILCLVLGYHISFDKRDAAFASDNLEHIVKNAAQNVKSSVGDIARGFSDAVNADNTKPKSEKDVEDAPDARSFYQSNPAATSAPVDYTGRAPVLQVPVQVESQDGKVEYTEDKDGFGNATIE